jgi:translation initiation factor IF-1
MSGWHLLRIPAKHGNKFEKKNGSRRVVCTINGTETFQCALMTHDTDFMIIVNKVKRQRLGVVAGDQVSVELKTDESKYGLPMPKEFREVLKQDKEGDRLFHALTPGKQRTVLYYIGKAKDIDRRIHMALVIIEHLKDNAGNIVYPKLSEELKRPIF